MSLRALVPLTVLSILAACRGTQPAEDAVDESVVTTDADPGADLSTPSDPAHDPSSATASTESRADAPRGATGAGHAPTGVPADSPLDPDNPEFLRRPHTAAQIRDAWVVGFEMKIENVPEGADPTEVLWRVVEADAESVMVEQSILDAAGSPVQSAKRRFSWDQIADQYRFPAGQATLEETKAKTPLGEIDCLRYIVWDDMLGTVVELLFAVDLPGFPVSLEARQDGTLINTTTVVARG